MKFIFSFLLIGAVFMASAQEQEALPGDSIPMEFRKQAYIYTLAKKYNDPAVARMALYNLIAVSQGGTAMLDSLGLLYFENRQYASAALVAQDALKVNPDDLFATELAAVAFDNLGVKNRAISNYEKLYLANNDLGTLYKVAFLQFESKRYGEALNNADIIIENEQSATSNLIFPTVDQKSSQEIPLRAAATRLKGMIEADRGNTSLALEHFNKALEMVPDFDLLKQQIENLDK